MHQFQMMQQQMQMPMPPANWAATPQEDVFQEMPPEMEAQVAMRSAQVAQQALQQQAAQQQAQQPPQKPQADPAAEEARKDMAFQAEEKRKQAAFEMEQQRKNQGLSQEVDREDATAGLEPTLVKQAGEFLAQAGIQMSPRELAVLSKALGRPFSETVQAIARLSMGGQGGGPAPIAEGMNNPQRAKFM